MVHRKRLTSAGAEEGHQYADDVTIARHVRYGSDEGGEGWRWGLGF
jgi:hypothetical protein